jgi:hypothetical protein
MSSPRRIKANRSNAAASTGPRTALGKSRAAQNARRHGLSASIFADPEHSAELADLAIQFAGEGARPDVVELGRRVAEAQIDLVRVRQARQDLIARYLNDPEFRPKEFARRAKAIIKIVRCYLRAFGPEAIVPAEVAQLADGVLNWKPQGAEKLTYILRDLEQKCFAMDRYERRALSRRRFAIRALDAARRQAVEDK